MAVRLAQISIVAWLLLTLLPATHAQSVTGQISGTVEDAVGSVIAGATVRLTHDLSKNIRNFTTDANGNFQFTGLIPGEYSLHISHSGFKGYDQRAINVGAEERVALHELKLTVGDVTSTVEVVAEGARVSTDRSDRSIVVTARQIEDTPISGRDDALYINDDAVVPVGKLFKVYVEAAFGRNSAEWQQVKALQSRCCFI